MNKIKIERYTNINYAGYRLKPNKILIYTSTGTDLGKFSEGIIINNGNSGNIGESAKGGLILNLNSDEIPDYFEKRIGFEAKNTVLINRGNLSDLGNCSESCILINQGNSNFVGTDSKFSIAINQGITKFICNEYFGINLGVIEFPKLKKCINLNFYNFVKQELSQQITKLEKKLLELTSSTP